MYLCESSKAPWDKRSPCALIKMKAKGGQLTSLNRVISSIAFFSCAIHRESSLFWINTCLLMSDSRATVASDLLWKGGVMSNQVETNQRLQLICATENNWWTLLATRRSWMLIVVKSCVCSETIWDLPKVRDEGVAISLLASQRTIWYALWPGNRYRIWDVNTNLVCCLYTTDARDHIFLEWWPDVCWWADATLTSVRLHKEIHWHVASNNAGSWTIQIARCLCKGVSWLILSLMLNPTTLQLCSSASSTSTSDYLLWRQRPPAFVTCVTALWAVGTQMQSAAYLLPASLSCMNRLIVVCSVWNQEKVFFLSIMRNGLAICWCLRVCIKLVCAGLGARFK